MAAERLRDPIDVIAEICHDQPEGALSKIAEVLGCGDGAAAAFQPIDTAPKDGTVIGAWSAGEPAIIRLVRWGRHLNGPRQPEGWVTITRAAMITHIPTHWIALGRLPGADGVPAAFDPTQPCLLTTADPTRTVCLRCKNPHHACDHPTHGVPVSVKEDGRG